MREEWLTTGFEETKPLGTKYDPYEMQDAGRAFLFGCVIYIHDSKPSMIPPLSA